MGKITVLSSTTKNPLSHIGEVAGICWNSDVSDKEKNVKRAKECIASGHGRVEEYCNIELVIEGYSARAIREWYTHHIHATRLQESTRYVNCEEFQYFLPPANEEAQKVYVECMNQIRASYKELLRLGMSKEDAANVLPLGMNTKIVDKHDLRGMINIMNMRLCTRAYKEMRQIVSDIKTELSNYSDEWKWICENLFVPKCEVSGFCTEAKCCGHRQKKSS